MKRMILIVGFLVALLAAGVGGFVAGYRQHEKTLRASARNPLKLELRIAAMEQEARSLQEHASDLQKQVASGVKSQAEVSEILADLEKTLVEREKTVATLREALEAARPPGAAKEQR